MSYDVEVKKVLGSTYNILLDSADSGKISEQEADTFFKKIDPSGVLLHKYKTDVKGSYGRLKFKEGLSLWYKTNPDIFDDRANLNRTVQDILRDKDLGKLIFPNSIFTIF